MSNTDSILQTMNNKQKVDYILNLCVQKATEAILMETNPTVNQKASHSKEYDEITSADYASQNAIISVISNLMPDAGMIAEEDNHVIQSKNGYTFVFDPIDGTKEFVRKGNEVSTMIACLYNGYPLAAIIHNPFTQERFTLSAADSKVYRNRSAGTNSPYDVDVEQHFALHPRNKALLTLEDMRSDDIGQTAYLSKPESGFFDPHLISTGSYGTNLMKLVSNQVAAVITKANLIYPWDAVPVFSILGAMGYCGYQLQEDNSWNKQLLRFDTTNYNEGILLLTQPSVFQKMIEHNYN